MQKSHFVLLSLAITLVVYFVEEFMEMTHGRIKHLISLKSKVKECSVT